MCPNNRLELNKERFDHGGEVQVRWVICMELWQVRNACILTVSSPYILFSSVFAVWYQDLLPVYSHMYHSIAWVF